MSILLSPETSFCFQREVLRGEPFLTQSRKNNLFPVVARINRVAHGEIKAERRHADRITIDVHSKQVVFENRLEIRNLRRFTAICISPTTDKSPKCFHQKNPRAASRIEDF